MAVMQRLHRSARGLCLVTATMVIVATLTALGLTAPHASAQTDPGPTTTVVLDTAKCVNSLERPNCGTAPQASGDRGGSAQLALLAIMATGTAIIGIRIAVGTRRNTLRRNAALVRRP
jgi:hypothetical protein